MFKGILGVALVAFVAYLVGVKFGGFGRAILGKVGM